MNTIPELIQHYRAQARKFNELADTIEKDSGTDTNGSSPPYNNALASNIERMRRSAFKPERPAKPAKPAKRTHGHVFKVKTPPSEDAVVTGKVPTVEELRGFLSIKAKDSRPIEMARYFGCSRREIKLLLTPENGFQIGHAGWVSLLPVQEGEESRDLETQGR